MKILNAEISEKFRQFFNCEKLYMSDDEEKKYKILNSFLDVILQKLPEDFISLYNFIDKMIIEQHVRISTTDYEENEEELKAYGSYLHLQVTALLFDPVKDLSDEILDENNLSDEYLLILSKYNHYISELDFIQNNRDNQEEIINYYLDVSGNPNNDKIDDSLQVIDNIITDFTNELKEFIPNIDPIVLNSLVENGSLPSYVNYRLRIKNDKKVDIVRFADFFGLTIAEINKIFTPSVDSNDRNKESKTGGILRILNKYKSLMEK